MEVVVVEFVTLTSNHFVQASNMIEHFISNRVYVIDMKVFPQTLSIFSWQNWNKWIIVSYPETIAIPLLSWVLRQSVVSMWKSDMCSPSTSILCPQVSRTSTTNMYFTRLCFRLCILRHSNITSNICTNYIVWRHDISMLFAYSDTATSSLVLTVYFQRKCKVQ